MIHIKFIFLPKNNLDVYSVQLSRETIVNPSMVNFVEILQ